MGLGQNETIADKIGAILMVDMAHPAGLIAAGSLTTCEICTHCNITTHKTLRGPRGGIILNREGFSKSIRNYDTKGEVKMMSAVLTQVFSRHTRRGHWNTV